MINAFTLFTVTRLFLLKNSLDKDRYVTIHTRNLQVLVTEMFKICKNLSPTRDHEITLKTSEFILNMIEKVNPFIFRNVYVFRIEREKIPISQLSLPESRYFADQNGLKVGPHENEF